MKRKFKVTSSELQIGELRLHHAANRELRPGRVRYFVQNMDPDALGRFAVWRQGRDLYLIDGQHRKVALEEMGLPDWPVFCDVYEGMSFAEACEQFLNLNNSLTVLPYDKYDKGVKAGRQSCVESQKVVEKIGFRIAQQSGDGKIVCVAAIEDAWKVDQGVSLERALTWATEAWGFTAQAAEGQIVRGLTQLAHRFNGDIDDAALVKKLSKHPGGASRLIGMAKTQRELKGGTVSTNVARAVVDLYNKGRRSGQLAPL